MGRYLEAQCPYCEIIEGCEPFQASPYELREHISKVHPDRKYPQWLMTQKELGFMRMEAEIENKH